MRFRRRMRVASSILAAAMLPVVLNVTAGGVAADYLVGQPVTTNALRDNPFGTVPIIKVTAADHDHATCSPLSTICSPRPSVTITLDSNDPNTVSSTLGQNPPRNLAGQAVYVWWLNGSEPADLGKTDCSTLTDPFDEAPGRRTRLDSGTLTFLNSVGHPNHGKAFLTVSLPPNPTVAAPSVPTWTQGDNWICATTVSLGDTGGIGDLAFTIKPA